MMPPSLLILGFGEERRIRLPLPLFLLWPLLILGWLVFGLVWLVTLGKKPGPIAAMLIALRFCHAMRGLRVDLRSRGENIYLSFI
jgi:hypothetical protein